MVFGYAIFQTKKHKHMKNFKEQQKIYQEIIKKIIGYLQNFDPKWIEKRTWFEDLKKFELGENFFNKVILANESSPKDKHEFYTDVCIFAIDDIQKKIGFEIDPETKSRYAQDEHEALLGYLWWDTIYEMIVYKEDIPSGGQKKLSKKRRIFIERIKGIEKRIY